MTISRNLPSQLSHNHSFVSINTCYISILLSSLHHYIRCCISVAMSHPPYGGVHFYFACKHTRTHHVRKMLILPSMTHRVIKMFVRESTLRRVKPNYYKPTLRNLILMRKVCNGIINMDFAFTDSVISIHSGV